MHQCGWRSFTSPRKWGEGEERAVRRAGKAKRAHQVCVRETWWARRICAFAQPTRPSLRHWLVGDIPVLAAEGRDVERPNRRVVVGRAAVVDAIQEIRRVEAGERRGLLQHVGAGEVVAAA